MIPFLSSGGWSQRPVRVTSEVVSPGLGISFPELWRLVPKACPCNLRCGKPKQRATFPELWRLVPKTCPWNLRSGMLKRGPPFPGSGGWSQRPVRATPDVAGRPASTSAAPATAEVPNSRFGTWYSSLQRHSCNCCKMQQPDVGISMAARRVWAGGPRLVSPPTSSQVRHSANEHLPGDLAARHLFARGQEEFGHEVFGDDRRDCREKGMSTRSSTSSSGGA